jgi:hypothetical protein
MKSPMSSQGKEVFTSFFGPEPALGVSRKNARRKSKGWIDNQHTAVKQGLTSTERQDQNLISGPGPSAKTRLLSFNRIQSRVFTGFLTGQDTLRTHQYITGVIDSPLCRRCEAEEESSAHVLYESWRHSNIRIWVYFSWNLRMLEVKF